MFLNSITKIIVALLLGLLVFSAATDAATTTTYSGATTTYSGTSSGGIAEQGKNVTNTPKTPVATVTENTVTEKASPTETATPSKKTSGFEIVLAIMTSLLSEKILISH